ncbi:MAG: hypothetical protein ACREA9_28250 [Pyrinomonadaceae bacterium]
MKRFLITSKILFKGTVALLAIPAVLVLIGAGLIVLQNLVGGGIGGFTFAVKLPDIKIAAAALSLIALLLVTGCWLLRRVGR